MSCFVITGGAGFIGSNLAEALLQQGHQVTIIDNFATGRRENIADLLGQARLVEGSICDERILRDAFDGADYVLHHAALPSVQRSVEAPLDSNEVNVTGTLKVLEAARAAGVRRVVFAASSSAYGDQPVLPKEESMLPDPLSPYAASKLAGEYYCKVYHHCFGLETVCLRYFNIFGPRQDPTSQYSAVIPIFITKLLAGERPTIFGDGKQSRDFTYVANVVKANLLAASAPQAAGHVVNIGCDARYSLNTMIRMLNDIIGTDIEPIYAAPRPGDVKHSHAAVDRARELLGYEPVVDFQEGLRRTVEWYKRQAQ